MEEPADKQRFSAANWAVQEVDQILSRFARYTRFVVFSKWFLMLLAIGLMSTLIAVPLLSKDRSGMRVSFVDKGLNPKDSAASSPVMNHPEYRGTGENGDQFKVNGLRAIQHSSSRITIEQVEGQLLSPNGNWRSLSAAEADYDKDAKTIVLTGDVTMVDEQGYQFVTDRATIDLDTMEASGDSPISGVGPLGNLLASGFKITDSGKRILFMGGEKQIHLTIDRKAKKA